MAKKSETLQHDLIRHFIEEDAAVRAYVRAVTRGHRETEDVIQEIWLTACRKIEDFDTQRPFRSWVMGIARVQVLRWRQSLARSREVVQPEVIEMLAETAEGCREELDLRNQSLRDCLADLPVRGKEILRLRYERGIKIKAISALLKKKTAAVEMTLVRLRRVLRGCIEERLETGRRGPA